VLGLAVLLALGAGYSAADEEDNESLGSMSLEDLLLEEVVVTARKREERLQDTPMSMSAYTAADLAEGSVRTLAQISEGSPNLLIGPAGPTPSSARIYIRGVGQDDPLLTADPGVGIYVDGVYLGRSIGSNFDLADVERVEILRGPQGTLYGKNTIGGAINVLFAQPTGVWDSSLSVDLGSDGQTDTFGYLSFPLLEERLFGRIAFKTRYSDGTFTNAYDGSEWSNQRRLAGRGALRFLPRDDLQLTLAYDKTYAREHPYGGSLKSTNDCSVTAGLPSLVCGTLMPAAYPGFLPDGNKDRSALNSGRTPTPGIVVEPDYTPFISSSGPSDNNLDVAGSSLTSEWDVREGLVFKSISAYRTLELRQALDVDSSPYAIAETFDHEEQWQVSQELQLLGSSADARLNWVGGAYYFHEDSQNSGETIAIPALASITGIPELNQSTFDSFENRSTTYALFANADYEIWPDWTVTAGLRFTHERKDFERFVDALFAVDPIGGGGLAPPANVANFDFNESDDWSAFLPKLGLSYRPRENLLFYGSVSRGFKSGGFNGRATNNAQQLDAFDPEFATAYELGVKSRWFDDGVQLNLAAFRTDYEDMQLTSFTIDPGTSAFLVVVQNAGRSRVYGLELEALARPLARLSLSGTLGLTHAEYLGFRELDINTGTMVDVSDRDFKNTPALTGSLGAAYVIPFWRQSTLTLGGSFSYQSEIQYATNNNDRIKQNAYGLFNGRVAWENANGDLEIALWGRNLADRRYKLFGLELTQTLGFTTAYWAPERSFGLEATVRW
jgi:iron complex outermembrane receptor protein